MKTLSVLTFIALVVVSNWLTARHGLVWDLFTAGTFTAGAVLLVRDWVRESAGVRWVFVCIGAGSAVSAIAAALTPPHPGGPSPVQLATASAVAFGLSEIADHYIYEPLRRSGKRRAAAWSNAAGSIVDSFLFLAIAGFPIWPAAASQVGVKWAVSILPLFVWQVGRALLRHPQRA